MDTLGAKRGEETVVSGGAIAVLPPLGLTNVKGGGDGDEGAIDEQTAGCDDDGAHYDMNRIGLDTPIQSIQPTNVSADTNTAAGFRVDTLKAKRGGETVMSGGAVAVLPPLGPSNVKGEEMEESLVNFLLVAMCRRIQRTMRRIRK